MAALMLSLPTNLLLRLRKRTLVGTDTAPCTIKLLKKSLIHSSRHIIIDTDDEEEDNKNVSPMVRGHWVTDICYNRLKL